MFRSRTNKKATVATGALPADVIRTQQATLSTGAPQPHDVHINPHFTPPEAPTYTALDKDSAFAIHFKPTPPHPSPYKPCKQLDHDQSGFAAAVSRAIQLTAQNRSETADSMRTIFVLHSGMHGTVELRDPTLSFFTPIDEQCMHPMHHSGSEDHEESSTDGTCSDQGTDTGAALDCAASTQMFLAHPLSEHPAPRSRFQCLSSAALKVTPCTGKLASSNSISSYGSQNVDVNRDESSDESSVFGSAISSHYGDDMATTGTLFEVATGSHASTCMTPEDNAWATTLDSIDSVDLLDEASLLDNILQGDSSKSEDEPRASITLYGDVPCILETSDLTANSPVSQQQALPTSAPAQVSDGRSTSTSTAAIMKTVCCNSSALLRPDSKPEASGARTQSHTITSLAQPPSNPPSTVIGTPPVLARVRTSRATPVVTNACRPCIPKHSACGSGVLQASLRSIINDACHATCMASSGKSVVSRLRRQIKRPYSFMEALKWSKQAVKALHKLHTTSTQAVHGDLTPDSLVLFWSKASGQKVKLVASKSPETGQQQNTQQLQAGSSVVDKLLYRAPEVLTGAQCDAKGDIFSFGVIMYELFSMHSLATTACIGSKHATLKEYLSRVHGGHREALDASWPQGLRQTIGMCWHDCPEIRPTGSQLRKMLDCLEPSIRQMDARFGSTQATGVSAAQQIVKRGNRFRLPWKAAKAKIHAQ